MIEIIRLDFRTGRDEFFAQEQCFEGTLRQSRLPIGYQFKDSPAGLHAFLHDGIRHIPCTRRLVAVEQAAVAILWYETQLVREACLIEYLRDFIDARAAIAFLLADEEHVTLTFALRECIIRIKVTGGEDVEIRRKGCVVLLGDMAVTCVEVYRHVGIARWLLRRARTDRRVVEGTQVATRIMREDVVEDIAATHLIDENDCIILVDVLLPIAIPVARGYAVRELQRTRHMEGKIFQALLRARQFLAVDAHG